MTNLDALCERLLRRDQAFGWVECEAELDYCEYNNPDGPEAAEAIRSLRAKLTVSEKMMERGARAAHLADEPVGEPTSISWEDLLPDTRCRYRQYSRACLQAALEQPDADPPQSVQENG